MDAVTSHKVTSHKDMLVWQRSVALASKIYAATAELARHERSGLSTQMRRSAIAVASNIAEGAGRTGRAEYLRFLNIARGSLCELETQVFITIDLKLIDRGLQLEEEIAAVRRLLTALIRRLREQRGSIAGIRA